MSAPRPIIICDTREQTPLRFSNAVDVVRGSLASGDYAIVAPDVPEYITRRRRPTKKEAPPPAFPALQLPGGAMSVEGILGIHSAVIEREVEGQLGEMIPSVSRMIVLPRRVERKSLADLVACCTKERERFEAELVRLAALRPGRAVVVVEASLEAARAGAYRSQTIPASVVGSTIAWWEDFGVPTIWAADPGEAARWVERWLVMALERHVEATRAELAEREAIREEA